MANMKFWIGAMLAELVVMLVIFDAVLYYYQSGLVYNLVNMKFKPKQGQDIPRKQGASFLIEITHVFRSCSTVLS